MNNLWVEKIVLTYVIYIYIFSIYFPRTDHFAITRIPYC